MHSFRCSDFCQILPSVRKKNDKNATKLSQMMMKFKSEHIVLQHMNHYKTVSEEENDTYIPDKYFYYQVYLNLVHFSSKSPKTR